jgi:D-amino-acid dehydrogenase
MAREKPPRSCALVIGGGLIGTACALNLLGRGVHASIIDPVAIRRAASWGNAGHIAVEQVEPLASIATLRSLPRRIFSRGGAVALPARDVGAWLPFSLRLLAASRPHRFQAGKAALSEALAAALPAWRRLAAGVGASQLLREQGHFIVWETPESAAAGRAACLAADTGTASVRDVTGEEMDLLSGLIRRRPAGAVRFIGSGQIADLGELADTLSAEVERLGGEQICAAARRLKQVSGHVAVELDDGRTLEANSIVVAAGVASRSLLEPLGYSVPIIAERGYHIQSSETDWPEDFPPVVFEDRSTIATRFRSGLRLASFVEFSRSDSPPDPRKWARLRHHASALGLSFEEPVAEWVGARPTLPDYLPAIGRSRRASNLYYAFGHQHLGLTLAAVTGEAVAGLIAGEPPALDLSRFDLERF